MTARVGGLVPESVVRWALSYARFVSRDLEELFKSVDMLVLPTMPTLPPAADAFGKSGWLGSLLKSTPLFCNAAIFNVSGHPAISIPGGRSSKGMPIGVQLVAPLGREDLLLSVAAQLERQQPWEVWEPRL
jgi:amidase